MARNQSGFTLLEMLVAVAIMAIALVAYTARLGISAEIQRSLALHGRMLDTAEALLEQNRSNRSFLAEKQGRIETESGALFEWRMWSEKTELSGFVRQNVEVTTEGEAPVILFLYRAL